MEAHSREHVALLQSILKAFPSQALAFAGDTRPVARGEGGSLDSTPRSSYDAAVSTPEPAVGMPASLRMQDGPRLFLGSRPQAQASPPEPDTAQEDEPDSDHRQGQGLGQEQRPSALGVRGGAKCTKEKNRAAQQRFRQRQKAQISDLKETAEQLKKVVDEQARTIEALTKENATLKEIIMAHRSGTYALEKAMDREAMERQAMERQPKAEPLPRSTLLAHQPSP